MELTSQQIKLLQYVDAKEYDKVDTNLINNLYNDHYLMFVMSNDGLGYFSHGVNRFDIFLSTKGKSVLPKQLESA